MVFVQQLVKQSYKAVQAKWNSCCVFLLSSDVCVHVNASVYKKW